MLRRLLHLLYGGDFRHLLTDVLFDISVQCHASGGACHAGAVKAYPGHAAVRDLDQFHIPVIFLHGGPNKVNHLFDPAEEG